MTPQEIGPIGKAVGSMIRRNLKKNFRAVYWNDPSPFPEAPVLFTCNHHGWHDGYVMYQAVKRMNLPSYSWIERYDAFPLFKYIHGLPYRRGNATERAAAIRTTVKGMTERGMSAVLFPEALLHPGPQVRPFGKAITQLAVSVPALVMIPTAIHYVKGVHERPEAFIAMGQPLRGESRTAESARDAVVELLEEMRNDPARLSQMTVLFEGTKDVDERWGTKLEARRKR